LNSQERQGAESGENKNFHPVVEKQKTG